MQVELGFAPIINPGTCPSGRASVICCTLARSKRIQAWRDRDPSSSEYLSPGCRSSWTPKIMLLSESVCCAASPWGKHATVVLTGVSTDYLFLNHVFSLDVQDSC